KGVLVGWALPAALMRPVFVVVGQVLAEYGEQVAGVIDQDPVQTLPAYRAYPALRVGVRPGRLRGCEEYLDALGLEHRVERAGVFGVAIPDQEPEPVGPLPQVQHQVAGGLGYPFTARVRGGAQHVDPPGGDLHQEQHVDTGQADRVRVQEVAGQDAVGLRGEELRPGRT